MYWNLQKIPFRFFLIEKTLQKYAGRFCVQTRYQGNNFIKWLLHTPLKAWSEAQPGMRHAASHADPQPIHIQVWGSQIKTSHPQQGWDLIRDKRKWKGGRRQTRQQGAGLQVFLRLRFPVGTDCLQSTRVITKQSNRSELL